MKVHHYKVVGGDLTFISYVCQMVELRYPEDVVSCGVTTLSTHITQVVKDDQMTTVMIENDNGVEWRKSHIKLIVNDEMETPSDAIQKYILPTIEHLSTEELSFQRME